MAQLKFSILIYALILTFFFDGTKNDEYSLCGDKDKIIGTWVHSVDSLWILEFKKDSAYSYYSDEITSVWAYEIMDHHCNDTVKKNENNNVYLFFSRDFFPCYEITSLSDQNLAYMNLEIGKVDLFYRKENSD